MTGVDRDAARVPTMETHEAALRRIRSLEEFIVSLAARVRELEEGRDGS